MKICSPFGSKAKKAVGKVSNQKNPKRHTSIRLKNFNIKI
jgi:hypothetical protein